MRGVSYQVRRIAVNGWDAATEKRIAASQTSLVACLPLPAERALQDPRAARQQASKLGIPRYRSHCGIPSFTQTCFMRVYSSIEYIDMSLPYPDSLKPPCGISGVSGKRCSLIHTQP